MATPGDAPHRRRFLHDTALIAAGGAVVATLSACPKVQSRAANKSAPVRLALIGEGSPELTKALLGHPLAQVMTTSKVSPGGQQRCQRAARKRQIAPPILAADWQRAIARTDVAAAVVSLDEPALAAQVIAACTQLGKPALYEIPVGELAATLGRPYLPHRAYAGLQQAIRFLQRGKLGTVQGARVLINENIQPRKLARLIDLACWGLGDCPIVTAEGNSLQDACLNTARHSIQIERAKQPVAGLRAGVVFMATQGTLACRDDSAVATYHDGEIVQVLKGSGDPLARFLRDVRAGKVSPDQGVDGSAASAAWRLLCQNLRNDGVVNQESPTF